MGSNLCDFSFTLMKRNLLTLKIDSQTAREGNSKTTKFALQEHKGRFWCYPKLAGSDTSSRAASKNEAPSKAEQKSPELFSNQWMCLPDCFLTPAQGGWTLPSLHLLFPLRATSTSETLSSCEAGWCSWSQPLHWLQWSQRLLGSVSRSRWRVDVNPEAGDRSSSPPSQYKARVSPLEPLALC